MELPPGLTSRPLTFEDVDAVLEVAAAQELHDVGEALMERADIVAYWQRPSFDLASSSVAVVDGDRVVAYATLLAPERCEVAVAPSHRGRGIGSWIARWTQDAARACGSEIVGMPVPVGSAGDRLLESLGYHVRWTSWLLRLPEGAAIEPQPLPDGYSIRTVGEEEHRDVWTVVEDAFLEWSIRERQPFEDFEAEVFRRPGFEPWQVRVATDRDGAVVGSAFVLVSGGDAFVEHLAVRRDQRNRGIARALLADAFAVGRQHGGTRAELSTDSRTGALSLYEKVGMTVTDTWVHRAIDL